MILLHLTYNAVYGQVFAAISSHYVALVAVAAVLCVCLAVAIARWGRWEPAAGVARNFAAVLERVRQVVEVIIEQDARPIAVLKSTPRTGGPISECIAIAKARGTKAAVDEGFAKDVEEAIRSHQEPWNPALLGLILDTSVGLPRSGAVLRVV